MKSRHYFFGILILFGTIVGLVLINLFHNTSNFYSTSINMVYDDNLKILLTEEMHHSARKRSRYILRMLNEKDPFELDNLRQLYNQEAREYISAELKLKEMNLSKAEFGLLEKLRKTTKNNYFIQEQAIQSIFDHELDKAKEIILTKSLQNQELILNQLLNLSVNYTKRTIKKLKYIKVVDDEKQQLFKLLFIIAGVFLALILVSLYYLNKTRQKNLLLTYRLNNIITHSTDAILSIDEQQIITFFNPEAQDLFGYKESEVIGKNLSMLIPAKFQQRHPKQVDEFKTSDTKKMEHLGKNRDLKFTGKKKNGNEFPANVGISRMQTPDKKWIFTAYIRDSSEQIKADKKLSRQKERAQLAFHKLKEMQSAIIDTEKMATLGKLVAGVAHEINTPNGIALTSATYIQKETKQIMSLYEEGELGEEELESYLEQMSEGCLIIEKNMQRSSEIVESFKRLSVDGSNDVKHSFSLSQLFNDIKLSLKPLFKHREITIEIRCDDNIEMNSYAGVLNQTLTNLIKNAIQHAYKKEDKGKIIVSAMHNKANDHILISVIDDGKGIDTKLHKKIYEPFYTTAKNSGGTGLGLQIIKNLVLQNLGGNISLDSKKGKGSTFCLNIPREFTFLNNK